MDLAHMYLNRRLPAPLGYNIVREFASPTIRARAKLLEQQLYSRNVYTYYKWRESHGHRRGYINQMIPRVVANYDFLNFEYRVYFGNQIKLQVKVCFKKDGTRHYTVVYFSKDWYGSTAECVV